MKYELEYGTCFDYVRFFHPEIPKDDIIAENSFLHLLHDVYNVEIVDREKLGRAVLDLLAQAHEQGWIKPRVKRTTEHG